MEELSLMVETMKKIAFGNALLAEMEKLGNYYLVETVVMNPTMTQRCNSPEYARSRN
jgi:hypothetical protein